MMMMPTFRLFGSRCHWPYKVIRCHQNFRLQAIRMYSQRCKITEDLVRRRVFANAVFVLNYLDVLHKRWKLHCRVRRTWAVCSLSAVPACDTHCSDWQAQIQDTRRMLCIMITDADSSGLISHSDLALCCTLQLITTNWNVSLTECCYITAYSIQQQQLILLSTTTPTAELLLLTSLSVQFYLRKITCQWHSATCHPTAVTFQPLPQPKLVLDLVTPEGCQAELT